MSLNKNENKFDGLTVIEISHFIDQRGMFSKIMSFDAMKAKDINFQIMQINHSSTS